jgi:hypothetical protein
MLIPRWFPASDCSQSGHPSPSPILKPCKIPGQGRRLARRCAIPAGPWTTSLAQDSSAPIGGMAWTESKPLVGTGQPHWQRYLAADVIASHLSPRAVDDSYSATPRQ